MLKWFSIPLRRSRLNPAFNLGLEVKALAAELADNFNGNAGPTTIDRGAELAEHRGHGVGDRNNDTSEKVSPRPVCPSRAQGTIKKAVAAVDPASSFMVFRSRVLSPALFCL